MLHKGSLLLVSLFLSAVIATRPSGSEGQSQHRTSLESYSRTLLANVTHHAHAVSLLNYNSSAHTSHGHRIQKVPNQRSYQAALKKVKETITTALTQNGAMNESTGDGQASHVPAVVPASNLQVRLSGNTIEPLEPSPTLEEHAHLLQDINAKLGNAVELNAALDAIVGANGDGGEGPEEDPMQKAADDWLSSATAANEKFAELQKNLKGILDSLRCKHEEYKQILRGEMADMISGIQDMHGDVDTNLAGESTDESADESAEESADESSDERVPSNTRFQKSDSETGECKTSKTIEECKTNCESKGMQIHQRVSYMPLFDERALCICSLAENNKKDCKEKSDAAQKNTPDGWQCWWKQKKCIPGWRGNSRGRG